MTGPDRGVPPGQVDAFLEEAAAYDNVGNREKFVGQEESSTFVDADFSDTAAPPAPQQLTADGAKVILAGMALPPNYGTSYTGAFSRISSFSRKACLSSGSFPVRST